MEKEEDFGGVGVAFRKSEEVEIVVTDIEILLIYLYKYIFQIKSGKGSRRWKELRLCPRLRNMGERLSFLLRLRRGAWETFRRRTWVYRLCSCGPEGSRSSTGEVSVCAC